MPKMECSTQIVRNWYYGRAGPFEFIGQLQLHRGSQFYSDRRAISYKIANPCCGGYPAEKPFELFLSIDDDGLQ